MYQRMYHPPLRSPLSLLSASQKHIHTGFYPPSRTRLYYLPTIYIYIYTYESIKCRLCLSGTKTLKLQIIGHFSCLSDSVLRSIKETRYKEEGAEKESRSLRFREKGKKFRGRCCACFRNSRISIHHIRSRWIFVPEPWILLYPNLCLRTSYT